MKCDCPVKEDGVFCRQTLVKWRWRCYNEGMLTEVFPRLNEARAIMSMRKFFRSAWFAAIAAVLMVCSEIVGLEIFVIYCYTFFGLCIVLLCDDMLGIVPMVCCGYMLFSAENNPGKFPDALFGRPQGQLALFYAIAVIGVLLIGRLISILLEREQRGVPKFTAGFVLLGIAYLLSGANSPYYDDRTVLMGFVQIASLCGFYFYFYYTIRWKNVPKGYLPMVVSIIGVGMLAEIVGMYFGEGVINEDGSVNRWNLYTGWGIYNNVGCVMAMCMPAPVFFAIKRKNGWMYTILGTIFYLGVLLTQSRGAMLFGFVVYLACIVATLVGSRGLERLWNAVVYAVLLAAFVISLFAFREAFLDLFKSVIDQGFNDAARFNTWKACWQRFLEYPGFGVGFYKTPGTLLTENGMYTEFTDGTPEGTFLALRAHNTFFQLIATGGLFALIAYAVHRIQTIWVCLRRPNTLKIVAALCVASLLLTSMVDCHVFNMGPGLMYSAWLVFGEKSEQYENVLKEKKETQE